MRDEFWLWLALVACVAVFAGMIWATIRAEEKCMESGGSWVKTGETTYYHQVGNMWVPVTSPVYGCVTAEKADQ